MADFTLRSNHNKNANFKSVVIGAGSEVLEVEMNEMQDIWFSQYQKLIRDYFGDGVMNSGVYRFSQGTLVMEDESVVVNGYILDITSLSCEILLGQYAYIKVWEEDVAFNSPLINYQGNVQETRTIPNYLMDTRICEETTRRVQIKYDLIATSEVMVNTDKVSYLQIGVLNTDGFKVTAKIVGYQSTKFREIVTLKASQSVITFSQPYHYGKNSLLIFLEGKCLVPTIDYVEVDTTTIRLTQKVNVEEGNVLYAVSDMYLRPLNKLAGHGESHFAWGDDPIDVTDLADSDGLIAKLRALTGALDIDCGGFTDAWVGDDKDYEYDGGSFTGGGI